MLRQTYIFGLVSLISLWFLASRPILAEDKPSGPVPIEQTVEKWTYSHYENDILYWQAAGNTADIVNGQKEFRVKIITLTYYLGLDDGITSTDQFLVLSAQEGIIKRDEQSAVFKNNIRVIMPKPTETSTEREAWVLEASVLNLQYVKEKGATRITIQSSEPVTLTQSTGFSITARSLVARPATVKSLGKNQITLKDAVLTRLSTDHSTGKDVFIRAEVMELADPPQADEIIVLDGEKEVLFSNPRGVVSDSNGSDIRLQQNVLVQITSEGKAIIYPNFHQIRFQDNAKLIQMEKSLSEVASTSNGDNARGSLQSDILNLFLSPNQNEIKKVLAEGNVLLVSREGKVARGEMLEWSPEKHLITVKSRHQVKVWMDNNVLVTPELKIHTGASSPETLGNWESIETSGGTLTIPPKK